MLRALICLSLALATSGCMTVLGYEPTPAELEAIRRGEDPRAGEDERREKRGNAGESGETVDKTEPESPKEGAPGPNEGTILRWIDSATVVIEANEQRETVLIAGEAPREDMSDEQAVLDDRMNRWTYGTSVRLSYPVKDKQGQPIYRDSRGNLIANID
jgi:hypothetical protein